MSKIIRLDKSRKSKIKKFNERGSFWNKIGIDARTKYTGCFIIGIMMFITGWNHNEKGFGVKKYYDNFKCCRQCMSNESCTCEI